MVFFSVAETILFCLTGFVIFRSKKNTIAESAAYAIAATLMMLSFLCQSALLVPVPFFLSVAEVCLLIVAVRTLYQQRACLHRTAVVLNHFMRLNPIIAMMGIFGCGYLALLAVFIPPGIAYWNSLSRIFLFQQHGLFSAMKMAEPLGPAFPINHAALSHLFLRFGSDMGVGIFGFLAYISIAFSTYALSRRYSWPSTAVTVTVIVISMPRLVYHASSPGNEILPAAMGLFSLLAAYRAVERLNPMDLLLAAMGIVFTVSDGRACIIFPVILLALVWMLLVRRHGARTLWTVMCQNRWWALIALIPMIIFSQTWLFLTNVMYDMRWAGSYGLFDVKFNMDGLQGSIANFLRYLLETIHFTLPIERFFRLTAHTGFTDIFQTLGRHLPGFLSGTVGLAEPFFISWEPNEIYSWFGPFGFLLVLPALVFAFRRGPRMLKTIAIAMAGYVYLVALIFAWDPGNARLFTTVFVCGGFFIAFFLPPWRFGKGGKLAFQWISTILFFYALIFNTMKPLVPIGRYVEADLLRSMEAPILKAEHFDRIEPRNIWLKTNWGFDRIAEARDYFGDQRVQEAAALLPHPARVAYVCDSLFHIYPFILLNANADIRVVSSKQVNAGDVLGLQNADAILCFGESPCQGSEKFSLKKVWPRQSKGMVSIQTTLLERSTQR